MGKNKHTPGPWKVIGKDKTEIGALLGTPEAIVIADTRFFQEPTNPRERADARLIAAAPDLLAACEAALDNIPYVAAVQWDYDLAQQLKAAIAKARGEAVDGRS